MRSEEEMRQFEWAENRRWAFIPYWEWPELLKSMGKGCIPYNSIHHDNQIEVDPKPLAEQKKK